MFQSISTLIWGNVDYKMKKRLTKDLGTDIKVEEFCSKLKSTESIIAGSYPLQVYHDETWEGSDIDIYTNTSEMLPYLRKYYGKFEEKSNPSKDGANYHRFFYCNLYEFNTPTIKIQLIELVNYSKTIDVLGTFDFKFCRIAFDGEKTIMSDEAKSKFCICDIQLKKNTKERALKYEKRGFTVTDTNKPE